MLLLELPKCIVVAQCMAVPAVLLCDLHTSHLTKQQSRRVSSEQFPSTTFVPHGYFIFCGLAGGKKAGGWKKKLAGGHVDTPDPER